MASDCGVRLWCPSAGYAKHVRNAERKTARVGGTLLAVIVAFWLIVVIAILLIFVV